MPLSVGVCDFSMQQQEKAKKIKLNLRSSFAQALDFFSLSLWLASGEDLARSHDSLR